MGLKNVSNLHRNTDLIGEQAKNTQYIRVSKSDATLRQDKNDHCNEFLMCPLKTTNYFARIFSDGEQYSWRSDCGRISTDACNGIKIFKKEIKINFYDTLPRTDIF